MVVDNNSDELYNHMRSLFNIMVLKHSHKDHSVGSSQFEKYTLKMLLANNPPDDLSRSIFTFQYLFMGGHPHIS